MNRLNQTLIALVWIAMLGVPIWVILSPLPAGYWHDASSSTALATITRLLGVTIFTLVTQQIISQAYRPFFNTTFPPLVVKRYHIVVGTATFFARNSAPAVALPVERVSRGWSVGPV